MPTPRPSATVVLLRDSDRGPQILFIKRRAGDAFGDAWTFPGGVLDSDEHLARDYCRGLARENADALLGVDDGLDYYSAVTRELFEETGVLLGNDDADESIGSFRDDLYAGQLAWTDFLAQHELTIACDELHYFAHWITPTVMPKRWTTRFFLAQMPDGQNVKPDGTEVVDSIWLTADVALENAKKGLGKLPYPTRKTLESFSGLDSIDAYLEWARQRQEDGIPTIQPEM
jgi:8-oxo-dGTP pyrophosphatase MutT (NUDIX family)